MTGRWWVEPTRFCYRLLIRKSSGTSDDAAISMLGATPTSGAKNYGLLLMPEFYIHGEAIKINFYGLSTKLQKKKLNGSIFTHSEAQ